MDWVRLVTVLCLFLACAQARGRGRRTHRGRTNQLEVPASSKQWYQMGRVARTVLHQSYIQIAPVENSSTPVRIGHSMSLLGIYDHRPVVNIVTFRARTHLVWQDTRLEWDSVGPTDVNVLHLKSDDIWTPETEVYPSLDDSLYSTSHDKHDIIVTSRGGVTWTYDMTYRVPCKLSPKLTVNFLTCAFRVWTPAFQSVEVALVPLSNVIKREDYVTADVFNVTDTNVTEELLTRGKEQFSVLQYSMTLALGK